VAAEYAKASYFVPRTLQSEDKKFTWLNGAKGHLAGPPKIHLGNIRLRGQEVEPRVVGVGNE
jgi:hypothetical protein